MSGRRGTLAAAAALITVAAAAAATLAVGGGDSVTVAGRDAPLSDVRDLGAEVVATGLVRPTGAWAAPGDDALWVTEQPGRLVRVAGRARTTVLDLRGTVLAGAERGLLGLAFHPDFVRNRRFFVNYTDRRGDTRVVEHRLGPGGRALPGSARKVLFVEQPEENHNGGSLLFATDGRLLVGMGDGGGAFDPGSRAQDPRERLGKLLAGDIDRPGRVRWQTLLTGLRNPWRIWMDPALNEIWLGDVGQDAAEEIDRVAFEPDEPPKNLGWPAWEGDRRIDADRLDSAAEPVPPVAVYGHDEGCSVTGGLIYRGRGVPALSERYVYGDFCTGTLWSLRPRPALAVGDIRRERLRVPQLTSIGADARGELVLTTGGGELLRIVRR